MATLEINLPAKKKEQGEERVSLGTRWQIGAHFELMLCAVALDKAMLIVVNEGVYRGHAYSWKQFPITYGYDGPGPVERGVLASELKGVFAETVKKL
jgi:hypothetical protein